MESDKTPLVSVIIPTYNRANLLKRAIKSVLDQTYKNLEIIIVDDGSTDNTKDIVKTFSDPRIQYIRLPENRGVSSARNMGIKKSRGDFIAFLDSDDEFLPEKLEKQSEIFRSLSKNSGLIFTNLWNLGKDKGLYVPKQIISGYILPSLSFPASIFSPPSTWMLRKNCIDQVGLFDEIMINLQDTDYFVRILQKFPIYFLNEALTVKHVYLTQGRRFSYRQFRGKERFLKKHFTKMKKDRKYLSRFYYGVGKDFLNYGKANRAKAYFLKAFTAYPKFDYIFKYLKSCIKRDIVKNGYR